MIMTPPPLPPPRLLVWSSTFQLVVPTDVQAAHLTGDKIILPHSVLQSLLSAADRAHESQRGIPVYLYSPLPSSAEKLPHPLMFLLKNARTGKSVFAGIREFSAKEGSIIIGRYLMEALGIEPSDVPSRPETPLSAIGGEDHPVELDGDDSEDNDADHLGDEGKRTRQSQPSLTSAIFISVTAKQAPKGTFVRLKSLEPGYDAADWKALLEQQLRGKYTTLTKHAVLSFKKGGGKYSFLIDGFEPESEGICVVDTDLEVDIQPLDEEQARETQRILEERGKEERSSEGGEIGVFKAVEGHVAKGEYVDYELPTWDRSRPLEISASGIEDEVAVDLFVVPRSSRHRNVPRRDDHVFGNFDTAVNGEKSLLQPPNIELEDAESLVISVYGHQASSYSLRVRVILEDSSADQPKNANIESTIKSRNPGDVECPNCHQPVPARTITLHENFCRRNNILCSSCDKIFQKSSPEAAAHWHCPRDSSSGGTVDSFTKHNEVFHTEHTCPSCSATFTSLPALAKHRTSVCPGKLILCQFCHLEVPQEGDPAAPTPEQILLNLSYHEIQDGSRTTECHLCDRIVRLRDMATHMKGHDLDKVTRATPQRCRNANCGRTRFGVGSKGLIKSVENNGIDRLGFCLSCYEPLYVQTHDPTGKAMRRRIERRYLTQLIAGCGKPWCRNPWCKTGRANEKLEPKGTKTIEALPMVKPLLERIWSGEGNMWFCVGEVGEKGRRVAERLAREGVWGVEWCVAAAEAEGVDEGRMRGWLESWAPRRI